MTKVEQILHQAGMKDADCKEAADRLVELCARIGEDPISTAWSIANNIFWQNRLVSDICAAKLKMIDDTEKQQKQ